jgi:hypothetical protein
MEKVEPKRISGAARRCTTLGVTSLLMVVAAIVLMETALACGVHCPHCNRAELGARYEFWSYYFLARDLLVGIGFVTALATLPWAYNRYYALGAILLTFTFSLYAG